MWLQYSGESDKRTDLEPADAVGIKSLQVFVRFSKFSHYVGLLPFNENKKKQGESTLLSFRTDIGKRGVLKVPKASPSFLTINTLRTGLLNCLNALSRDLNFRHRASCI